MTADRTITFSPFTRVEGDLSLHVEVADGRVSFARASGTLFRGFEEMVRGRAPLDALVLLPRICGQCGAAHSAASAAALAAAFGIEPPPNGVLAASLIQAVEALLSHLSHFCFTFMADLSALDAADALGGRFTPVQGRSFQKWLRARRLLLGLMGLLAGKWPNTLAIHPGGVTRPLARPDLTRARSLLAEFTQVVQGELLRCSLGEWLQVRSLAELDAWLEEGEHAGGDLGAFLIAARRAGLQTLGRGPGRFLSAGAYCLPNGRTWLQPGYYADGVRPLDPSLIREHLACSWFEGREPLHPSAGRATSAPDKEGAYSWAKAPRYGGLPAEVGAMARMVVDGDALALDLLAREGPSVFARVLLRLHEMVRLLADMPGWLAQIEPDEPFYAHADTGPSAEGFALTEAPRGMLGHWLCVEKGRIRDYQVITPTGWNLSPRDEEGRPGPLEFALEGTPVADPDHAGQVALVVRSYDPCLYCSVH